MSVNRCLPRTESCISKHNSGGRLIVVSDHASLHRTKQKLVNVNILGTTWFTAQKSNKHSTDVNNGKVFNFVLHSAASM